MPGDDKKKTTSKPKASAVSAGKVVASEKKTKSSAPKSVEAGADVKKVQKVSGEVKVAKAAEGKSVKVESALVKKVKHDGPTLTLKQVKSGAGRYKSQVQTLKGLGLGKINRVVVVQDTPSIRGMVSAVKHLVQVI